MALVLYGTRNSVLCVRLVDMSRVHVVHGSLYLSIRCHVLQIVRILDDIVRWISRGVLCIRCHVLHIVRILDHVVRWISRGVSLRILHLLIV